LLQRLGSLNSIIFCTLDATVLFLSNGKGACEKTALLSTTAGGKVRLVVVVVVGICITVLTKVLCINKGMPIYFIFCNDYIKIFNH